MSCSTGHVLLLPKVFVWNQQPQVFVHFNGNNLHSNAGWFCYSTSHVFFKLILGAITIQEQRGPWMNYIITQFLSSQLISIGNPIHDPFFWVSPKVIIQGVAMRRGRLMMMVGQSEWTPSFRETHLLFASVIACVWLSLCFPCRRNIS